VGIENNKTVDQLARLVSEWRFIGPEPAYDISAANTHKAVRDWKKGENKKYCDSLTGLRQTVYHEDPLLVELRNC
jgi:hypothetical protein